MATEKKINTRIQLKYSTLTEWSDLSAEGKGGNLVLKSGEVGICAIPVTDPQKKVAQEDPPAIMFKVGDGVTAFKDLPWASALAADVYTWAKKSVPAVSDFGDIITAARDGLISADSVVKTLNELKGDVTIASADGDTHIIVAKDGQKITLALKLTNAEAAALTSGITAAKVGIYDGYAEKITAAQNKADAALPEVTFNTFKTQNTKDIAAAKKAGTDAADALSAYQTSNDDAVAGKVDKTTKVNGHVLSADVTVTKGDVGLGNVENKTLDTTVTASSGNYITSGAVKTYVDNAVGAVTQFKYEVVTKLPTAAVATMGKIYLVAHTHGAQDGYDEYITIESGDTTKTYTWEKIGNTDIDLSQYVNGISGTTDNGVITNITKDGNTITVTSKSLETADPVTEAGDSRAFITSITQAKDGKITAHKQNIPTATKSGLGLVKGGTTSGKVYGVDIAADGSMTVSVPWENTQNANTWRPITLGGTPYKTGDTTSGALDLRAGSNVDISIDTDTNKGVKIAAKNQTVKVGKSTFGADDAVEIKAGTNVTVSADTVNKTITVNGKSDADINSLITAKINDLDVSNISGFGAGKTLKTLTETDGKIAATFQDISITASHVSDFNTKVDARISNHSGVDKVGTVTSVSAGEGLKVTGTASVAPKIEIDTDVVFVFDCGSATVNVD